MAAQTPNHDDQAVLWISTCGEGGQVAWYDKQGSCVRAVKLALGPRVGQRVLATAAALVEVYGRPVAVAVCVGPGWRTSALRAGVVAANCLAWAWGVPVLSVPAGASAAEAIRRGRYERAARPVYRASPSGFS